LVFRLRSVLFDSEFISYVLFTILLIGLLVFVSQKFSVSNIYKDKVSPYECGFKQYSDTRDKIFIPYYLTLLVFVVFDVEVVFLVP
jgi:NADH-quinone oxidoreductase subunit A